MQRCETCKYFSIWQKEYNIVGACSSPKFLIGYHHFSKETKKDEVLVENDEGWGFIPGPKFGCVHHEEKEKEKEQAK